MLRQCLGRVITDIVPMVHHWAAVLTNSDIVPIVHHWAAVLANSDIDNFDDMSNQTYIEYM